MPALSSDSDKDGEDEGNDEDELRGLQSFHIQSSCNTERDSGINGRGARAGMEKKGMNVNWGENESHWLRDNKIWAERERPRQKQMDQHQWVMWSCTLLHLKRGTFRSSLIRNSVVKLPSFLLVPTGQSNFELVSWALVYKLLEVHRTQKRSHEGFWRRLIKLTIETTIRNLRYFYTDATVYWSKAFSQPLVGHCTVASVLQ